MTIKRAPRLHQAAAVEAVMASPTQGCTVVMATGGGKTYVAALYVIERNKALGRTGKALMVQHTTPLCRQNHDSMIADTGLNTTMVKARRRNFSGDLVIASSKTLENPAVLANATGFDTIIIDEAHHSGARRYRKTIDQLLKQNPNAKIVGLTATPERADGVALHPSMNFYAYQWTIHDGIESGHLVPPKSKVFHTGVSAELAKLKMLGGEVNMKDARGVLDHQDLNRVIVEKWQEHASDRKTIAFCTTIEHAENLYGEFLAAGVNVGISTSGMTEKQSDAAIDTYKAGKTDVLISVMSLTEGFDDRQTSCAIIARPMNHESTLIQAIGRTLRSDEENGKVDSLVLDFSAATMRHPNLQGHLMEIEEVDATIPRLRGPGVGSMLENQATTSGEVDSTDLVYTSEKFRWTQLPDVKRLALPGSSGPTYMATNIDRFAMLAPTAKGEWLLVQGLNKKNNPTITSFKTFQEASASGMALLNKGKSGSMEASGSMGWTDPSVPATERQADSLRLNGVEDRLSKYQATCVISAAIHRNSIQHVIQRHIESDRIVSSRDTEKAAAYQRMAIAGLGR